MRIFKSSLAFSTALLLATGGCGMVQFTDSSGGSGGGGATQSAELSPDALRGAVRDEPLRRFYAARDWQPAFEGDAGNAMIEAIQGAERHGLDPARFTADIERAQSPVEREAATSRAALAYATALHRGHADPGRIAAVYTVPRPEGDVAGGLAQAVRDGNVREWIESQAPQDEEYRALSEAYVEARRASAPPQKGAAPAEGDGATAQNGQQPADEPSGNQQQPRAAAPARQPAAAQNRQQASRTKQGQGQRGQRGQRGGNRPATREQAAERAIQLAVNLERRRWLHRQPDATRIDVNTAGAFLKYIRDNAVADRRVVVVGQPAWETPELGSPIFQLVANPNWTVPESIQNSELANLSEAQLTRRNMSRRGDRIVQEPGADNALGQVKFDMHNNEAIYLHDTPSRGAFGRSERHLSHGCVRVRDALGFARMLAEHDGKLEQFNEALATGETTMVPLSNRVPVRLLYHTAYLDEGRLVVAPDAYGWDAIVARALGYDVPLPPRPTRETSAQAPGGADTGP